MTRLLRAVVGFLLGCALVACSDDDAAEPDAHGTTSTTDAAPAPLCSEHPYLYAPSEVPAPDADPVTITAVEEGEPEDRTYVFSENATAELAGLGTYAVTFRNDGEEVHELVLLHLDEGEVRSAAGLLLAIAGGTDPTTFADVVGATSACPGEATVLGADLRSTGRYLLVCNLTVGTAPGLDGAQLEALQGPTHAERGMVTEVVLA